MTPPRSKVNSERGKPMVLTQTRIESLREQFPALQRKVGGRPAVFFDGPAGTPGAGSEGRVASEAGTDDSYIRMRSALALAEMMHTQDRKIREIRDAYVRDGNSIAAELYRGQVGGRLGDPDDGIARITSALAAWQTIGVGAFRGWFLGDAAEFEVARGNGVRGLEVIEGALAHTREVSEGLTEVRLLMQKGKLLGQIGDDEASAAGLIGAIEAARSIGARLPELQAATELARLHERRGEPHRAEKVLRRVYSRFTEGFDTPHLVAARAVLERL